ncbi:MAG: hypothetical protein ACRD45_15250, partial [Bryobacteraceae bacterium]
MADLEKLRHALSKGKRGEPLAPATLKTSLQKCRSFFLYANENLIDKPVKYRRPLASPARRLLRQAVNATGPRMFAAGEIRAILEAATPTMRAWVLLGLNAAFGPEDCASLPVDKLDLETGWHTYGRSKTGIGRRAKL